LVSFVAVDVNVEGGKTATVMVAAGTSREGPWNRILMDGIVDGNAFIVFHNKIVVDNFKAIEGNGRVNEWFTRKSKGILPLGVALVAWGGGSGLRIATTSLAFPAFATARVPSLAFAVSSLLSHHDRMVDRITPFR
jgi:hypothetical protein